MKSAFSAEPTSSAAPEEGRDAPAAPPAAASPTGRRRRLAAILTGAALLLAGLVAWQAFHLRAVRAELEDKLVAAGIDDPASLARLRNESTPLRARLLASRLIVHRVIAAEPAARPQAAALLPTARELAAGVLASQPSDWQASMLLGTATYLEWSLAQDRRLFTEAARWEKPLENAIALAPTRLEPQRLLATAYLEVWYALSPAKKTAAKKILKGVFAGDQRAYRALLPAFIAAASSSAEIFEVIPAEPGAWADLERIYGERRSFGALAAAHEKRLAALEARLETRYQEAAERLRLGDFFNSRSLLLKNVVEAPPSARFAPHVAKALELYPPGLHGLASVKELRAWLTWLLELDRIDLHPLAPALVGRLLDAVGEIDPAVGAHAALVAGDPYQAERYARLSDVPQLEAWGPYLIARARQEIRERKLAEAREKLDMVYLGTQREAPYLLARLELAQALGDAGGIALARGELARQQKR